MTLVEKVERLIKGMLLGTAIIAVGCENKTATNAPQPAQVILQESITQPTYKSTLADQINRVMRSFESWVVDFIESDYTKEQSNMVQLRMAKDLTHASIFGIVHAAGIYDSKNKCIKLKNVDSLPHEIAHAIFDEDNNQGIFFSQKYKGPTIDEWKTVLAERRNNKTFKDAIDKKLHIAYLESRAFPLETMLNRYNEDLEKIAALKKENKDDELMKHASDYERILNGLFAAQQTKAMQLCKNLDENSADYENQLNEFVNIASQMKEQIASLADYFLKNSEDFKKILRSKNVKFSKTPHGQWITSAELENIMGDLDTTFKDNSIILRDTELFARIIDSVIELYINEPTVHNFTVNEKELDLLAKMQYANQPMFRKAVEKYQLALQMKDPKKIAQMVYATRAVLGGKQYDWPENSWTLKGDVIVEK